MLNLVKGQSVPLTKTDGTAISKIRVGLSWDVASIGQAVDLDLSIAHKETKNVAFYNARNAINWVELSEDNRTWEGDWDDEFAILDATKTADWEYIVFINIFDAVSRWQAFNLVNNAKVTVYNAETNEALVSYSVTENGWANTALIVCSLKDSGDKYDFTAKWDFVNWNINEIVASL